MKIAFLCPLFAGGIQSWFLEFSKELATHDIHLVWINPYSSLLADPDFTCTDPNLHIESIPPKQLNPNAKDITERVTEHLISHGYHGVIINILTDSVFMNLIRFIPDTLLKIQVIHSSSSQAARAAIFNLEFTDYTFCVSQQIFESLKLAAPLLKDRLALIPNGINPDDYEFKTSVNTNSKHTALRLLYLGRLNHQEKGVLYLPQIMKRIPPDMATLTIAGNGPDFYALSKAFSHSQGQVHFLGHISRSEAKRLLTTHHILLFPSNTEGFGLSLIEAMASGCIPISSKIDGVTDWILEDGDTGFLCKKGDTQRFSDKIRLIHSNPELRLQVASHAREAVILKFHIRNAAAQVSKLIHQASKRIPAATQNMEEFCIDSAFSIGRSRYFPTALRPLAIRIWNYFHL